MVGEVNCTDVSTWFCVICFLCKYKATLMRSVENVFLGRDLSILPAFPEASNFTVAMVKLLLIAVVLYNGRIGKDWCLREGACVCAW